MRDKLIYILFIVLFLTNISFSSQMMLIGIRKIIVCNFWEKSNDKYENKYIFYNPFDEDITLTINVVNKTSNGINVSTEIDSNFSQIGPINIKTKNYVFFENIFYQNSKVKDKLLQFIMNDSLFIGNICTIVDPPPHFSEGKINTFNMHYRHRSNTFWSQDQIVFEEDTDYSINLNIYPYDKNKKASDRQIMVLVLSNDTEKKLRHKLIETIKSVDSKTLQKEAVNHEAIKEAYQFNIPYSDNNLIHTITISFKTPKVNEITYRHFVAVDSYNGGRSKISLIFPIIIVPQSLYKLNKEL